MIDIATDLDNAPALSPETASLIESAVEAAFSGEVEVLQRLVGLPTIRPPGDFASAGTAIAELVADLGFAAEAIPVPQPFTRQYGLESLLDVVGRLALGAGGPTVCLSAAADTAPAGDGWTTDPFGGEVRDGRIYGRGTASSKGDIACFLFAAKAVSTLPGLSGAIEVHIGFDDETGGFLGPQFLLAQELAVPDLAIAAGETHTVTVAQGGLLQLDVVLRGVQAHASASAGGHDALEAAMPVLSALYAERARLEALPRPAGEGALVPRLTIGTISGGSAANLVPDRVKVRLDRRLTEKEDGGLVETGLVSLVARAASGIDGIEAECHRRLLLEPVLRMDRGSGLAALVRREAEAVIGAPVPEAATAVLSGARFYAAAGIPTVGYGVGPRGAGGRGRPYGPDEAIALSDLKASTIIVARTLAVLLRAR